MKAPRPHSLEGEVYSIQDPCWVRLRLRSMDTRLRPLDRREPMQEFAFVFGRDRLLPGLEEALLGASVGMSKRVHLSPEKAYGVRDEEATFEIEREAGFHVRVGEQLTFDTADGHSFVVWVAELRPESILLDENHPLAGRSLVFDIQVLEVRPATPQELARAAPLDEERELEKSDVLLPASRLVRPKPPDRSVKG